MTWVGWILVIELFTSSLALIYKAGQGDTIRTPAMALFQSVEMFILGALVLFVGTGSL